MATTYKVKLGRFENYQGEVSTEFFTGDFAAAFAAKDFDVSKALTNLRRVHSFSYRARTDRPKCFKGAYASQLVSGNIHLKSKTLEELVVANNIPGYVKAWTQINHLVQ